MAASVYVLPRASPDYDFATMDPQGTGGGRYTPFQSTYRDSYGFSGIGHETRPRSADLAAYSYDTRSPSPSPNKKYQRPKTAMAAIDRPKVPNDSIFSPYMTSYKREYSSTGSPAAQADRPRTARGAGYEASFDPAGPIGNSTYQVNYYERPAKITPVTRTGSSSGNRRNNPHPLEAFMVWRFPQKPTGEKRDSQWASTVTDEMMDKVSRGMCTSTYQTDYLGLPQGYMPKDVFGNLPEDWKAKVPYTLDSCVRYNYQVPNQQPILKGNNTRYGCNRTKKIPALGVVPVVSSQQIDLKKKTTYEREYSDTGGDLLHNVQDLGRIRGSRVVQNYLAKATPSDKEALARRLDGMKGSGSRTVRSPSKPSFTPAATSLKPGTPDYLSKWTGPQ